MCTHIRWKSWRHWTMWGWLLKRKLLLSNTLKYLYYVRAVRVSLSTANPPDLMTFHLPKKGNKQPTSLSWGRWSGKRKGPPSLPPSSYSLRPTPSVAKKEGDGVEKGKGHPVSLHNPLLLWLRTREMDRGYPASLASYSPQSTPPLAKKEGDGVIECIAVSSSPAKDDPLTFKLTR